VPVRPQSVANLYKPRTDIVLPSEEKLQQFRQFVRVARVGKVTVDDATSEYIQHDFVRARQQEGISADDLILRMSIAK
jgi:hypothetical protein